MTVKTSPWTEEEIKFLLENYKKMRVKEIAKHLNRSIIGVVNKYQRLRRLSKNNLNLKRNKLFRGVEVRKRLEEKGITLGDEKFACPVCGELYDNMIVLKKHFMQIHYLTRICPICNIEYKNLNTHFIRVGYDTKNDEVVDEEHLVLYGLSTKIYSLSHKIRRVAQEVAYNFCSTEVDGD